jgi:hypothetical protein
MDVEVRHARCSMQCSVFILGFLFCLTASAATLEKLTIEQMAKQSTMIVRGRVTGCAGETRGRVIYTRCGVAVSETWKGAPGSRVEFIVPGGRVRDLMQAVTGAPQFSANQQNVLFLWVGRSGIPQIIGLSQGVFDVSFSASGDAKVHRAATTERILDSQGQPVRDESISLSVSELRRQVTAALEGGNQE